MSKQINTTSFIGGVKMKRKIVCCCLCLMLLTACSSDHNYTKPDGFTVIKENLLYYANDTHIVYYLIHNQVDPHAHSDVGFGFMAPYYDNNGKLCKYENNVIVEIN